MLIKLRGLKMDYCIECGEYIDNGTEVRHDNLEFCSIKCLDMYFLTKCANEEISFLDLPKETRDRESGRSSYIVHPKTCPVCGTIFYIRYTNEGNRTYCSEECYRSGMEPVWKKQGLLNTGWLSPNWRGGITNGEYCNKFNADLRRRVRVFFKNKCFLCGKPQEENGKRLAVHHVNYNKNACCDSSRVMMVPLCLECHGKTNHDRERWEDYFEKILKEQYNYKCYYTKEEYNNLKAQELTS